MATGDLFPDPQLRQSSSAVLAVLQSAEDENNHLPHGQVQHTINFTVFFHGFINSMAEHRELKNHMDNPFRCRSVVSFPRTQQHLTYFSLFFTLSGPKIQDQFYR